MRWKNTTLGLAAATLLGTALLISLPTSADTPSHAEDGTAEVTRVPAPPVSAPPIPPEVASSRKDDPGARRDFELSRLVDPATGRMPTDIQRREREFAAKLPSWNGQGGIDALLERQAERDGSTRAKAAGWAYRGPVNIGGRTRALALDVSDASFQTLLAGGISGGMWRSTDEGASWTLTTGSSQLHSVTAIAQDTRAGQHDTWYYGTGEVRGNSAADPGAPFRGDGVFKSTDGGQTWSVLPSTSTGQPQSFDQNFDYVWRLVLDASNTTQDEIYAATYAGIQRSIDGGATWTLVLGDPVSRSRYVDVVISSTGVLYASLSTEGTQNGIYRSPDGVNWTKISTLVPDHSRIVLGLAPSDETILYALVADYDPAGTDEPDEAFFKYLYLQADGAGTNGVWLDRSASIQSLPNRNGPNQSAFVSYTGYCQTIAVHPTNPDIVTIGGLDLIRSTDGFASSANTTWIGGFTYNNHHADVHWMFYRPGSSSIAYTGSDGGVHKTSDANAGNVVWQSFNNGYNTSQFYTVAIDEADLGNPIVLGGMQDNGTWQTDDTGGATPWIEIFGGDGSFCGIADASGSVGTYYVSVQNGVIYRVSATTDTGSWLDWARVDPAGGSGYQFINPFILDPDDRRRLYLATSNGVWRNSNAEAVPSFDNNPTSVNWTQITTEPAGSSVGGMAVATDGSGTLYYGANDGHVYAVPNAPTTSAGSTPTNLTSGKGLPSGYVSSIAVDPDDASRILICYSNYNIVNLWFTDDAGSTWTAIEGNLSGTDSPSVRSVAILPTSASTSLYLAATSTGLYSTEVLQGAQTVWQLESPNLIGNTVVDMLKVRPDDGLVVAATHGKGMYSVIVEPGTPVTPSQPQGVYLSQNSPNPFNPSTSISFRTTTDGPVRLTIYDVAGRAVRHLVDQSLAAGNHVTQWDAKDDSGRGVATGAYVYAIESGGETVSLKMTLVK